MDILSLFLGICAFLGALAFMRLTRLNQRMDALERKINELSAQIKNAKQREISELSTGTVIGQIPPSESLIPKPAPVAIKPSISSVTSKVPLTVRMKSEITVHPAMPDSVEVAFSWLKENWAGFLGVAILVLGITFGTVYLSFFASPFVRFLILIGIGLGLLGAGHYIRNKSFGKELSAWLRSASGAIVLFTVLASSFIEALHFYHSPQIGLELLIAGLAYNIVLAYFASKEVFASFHVLISLIALVMVPKELTVLFTAITVAIAGVGLSTRHPWNSNLLVSFIGYSIFHILWLKGQHAIAPVALYGVIGTSLVGACALLVHYHKIYQELPQNQSLFSHSAIWLLLGFQLALYNLGFAYLFIPLGGATIACFILSSYAKKHNIEWLYICDALVGQILAIMTILSLTRVNLNHEMIAWIAFIESLCFTTLTYWLRQNLLSKIGLAFMLGAFLILSFMLIGIEDNPAQVCIISLASLLPLYIVRNLILNREQSEQVALDTFAGVFPLAIDAFYYIMALLMLIIGLSAYLWGYSALVVGFIAMSVNKRLMAREYHKMFYLLFATLAVVYTWYKVPLIDNKITAVIYYGIPPIILLLWLLKEKIFTLEDQSLEDMWVYLVGFHVGIVSTILAFSYSPFIPGALFLIYGLLFFEFGMWLYSYALNKRCCFIAIACKNMAFLYLIGYTLLYLLLYIQSESSLFSYLSLPQALTIMACALSLYWYFSKPIVSEPYPQIQWRISVKALPVSQAVPFDIAFIFILCLLISTFSAPIHPLGYGMLGLALSVPNLRKYLPNRALVYAVCLLMAVCVQVAIVSSKWASPLSDWYQNTHITGPISMVLALGVASLLLRKPEQVENKILKLFYKEPVLVGFLPIFTALGLFLMWRFDKAYLTMLWVVEVAIVVAVGFYLRSKMLVHIALLFLVFCVCRLMIYDLAQTTLIIKAFVFIVVGLLMIFIHIVYKKYASRLS
ncbi:MAG: hypothetical protein JSR17_13715 [Proteobacteria bacterium]|nr:hypothetical protein [Pseudomonadota bacterium]